MQVWFSLCLNKDDGLDESGIRYNYARFESEDAKVVPYNRELLSYSVGFSG